MQDLNSVKIYVPYFDLTNTMDQTYLGDLKVVFHDDNFL